MSGAADVEARLRRLTDLQEIHALKALYCRWVDSGYDAAGDDPAAFAALFTEDGVWAAGAEPAIGREAIAARAAASRRFRLHLAANAIVDVAGGRASGTWHALVPTVTAEGRAVWLAGTYEDTFVRTDAGWKFERVVFHTAFRTPYDEGWALTPFL
jgi:hypothetical protein